jgi:hypothetical protein
MQNIVKNGAARLAVLTGVVGVTVLSGLAFAGPASAAADPVGDAFADMQTKIVTYGGLIVGLVIAGAIIFLGIKYLRKGLSKA